MRVLAVEVCSGHFDKLSDRGRLGDRGRFGGRHSERRDRVRFRAVSPAVGCGPLEDAIGAMVERPPG